MCQNFVSSLSISRDEAGIIPFHPWKGNPILFSAQLLSRIRVTYPEGETSILIEILVLSTFLACPLQEDETAEELVQVTLQAYTEAIHPGQAFHIAVRFKIAPQWHIYWKSAGDSGLPIEIEVDAPEGFQVSKTLWPRPTSFVSGDFVDYGYEEKATLFVPVKAPLNLKKGKVTFRINVGIFVCSDICLDGNVERTVTLPTLTKTPEKTQTAPPNLRKEFRALPKKATEVQLKDSSIYIRVPAGTHKNANFFPIETPGVRIGKAIFAFEGGQLEMRAPVKFFPKNALGKPIRIEGLIVLGKDRFDPSFEFILEVPE